jgi:maleylacetoacetate isomerase
MTQPILYSYWRSSCSYRVRIALEYKQVPYEYRAVHLVKDGGEQTKPEYRSLNPMAQVPTLIHGHLTLTQSLPILQYLEDAFPEPALLPSDSAEKAVVLSLCEDINSGMQPVQNLSVLKHIETTFNASAEDKKAWAHYWIHRGFEAFEKRLEVTAGSYCFGDQVTLVDCLLVPQVYNALRFAVDLDSFPHIKRIHETCNTLEPFIKAHPDQMPDAQ